MKTRSEWLDKSVSEYYAYYEKSGGTPVFPERAWLRNAIEATVPLSITPQQLANVPPVVASDDALTESGAWTPCLNFYCDVAREPQANVGGSRRNCCRFASLARSHVPAVAANHCRCI